MLKMQLRVCCVPHEEERHDRHEIRGKFVAYAGTVRHVAGIMKDAFPETGARAVCMGDTRTNIMEARTPSSRGRCHRTDRGTAPGSGRRVGTELGTASEEIEPLLAELRSLWVGIIYRGTHWRTKDICLHSGAALHRRIGGLLTSIGVESDALDAWDPAFVRTHFSYGGRRGVLLGSIAGHRRPARGRRDFAVVTGFIAKDAEAHHDWAAAVRI
jgi:hypothetical protein